MINIKKLQYKNFFSCGNFPITIDFESSSRILVMGVNGSGKSTIIEALCFGIFGKSFREVNKPDVINSINKKALEINIWLEANGRDYRIQRGIKPNVFQVFENDKLIEQTASSKDYQEYIEKTILNLNFNAFKQIVILGSGVYVPFMRLPAASRREVVENLLDLSIFSVMSNLIKEKISVNNKAIEDLENDEYRNRVELQAIIEQINFVKRQVEKQKEESDKKLKEIDEEISIADQRILDLQEKLLDFKDLDSNRKKIEVTRDSLSKNVFGIQQKIAGLKKDSKFYEENDNCPVCRQTIQVEFKAELVDSNNLELEKLAEDLKKYNELSKKLDEATTKMNIKEEERSNILSTKSELLTKKNNLLEFKSKIDTIVEEQYDIDSIKEKAVRVDKEKNELVSTRESLQKKKELYQIAALLTKDSGIKAKIIEKYIPLINKYINQYLDSMNFYVQFKLDENFKETIRSRYRDSFSYENFSEGQKARINLALLFTWRMIAKMKNSMNVNLLIFDEVADSALDKEGIECFLKIIGELTDTNVLLISHKTEEMSDHFTKVLQFKLSNNFSVMEESNL